MSKPDLFKDEKVVPLQTLEIGDIFFNIKDRNVTYIVRGNPVFNKRHGSATRMCQYVGRLESKSCRINVVKIGESKFKEQYKLHPINSI